MEEDSEGELIQNMHELSLLKFSIISVIIIKLKICPFKTAARWCKSAKDLSLTFPPKKPESLIFSAAAPSRPATGGSRPPTAGWKSKKYSPTYFFNIKTKKKTLAPLHVSNLSSHKHLWLPGRPPTAPAGSRPPSAAVGSRPGIGMLIFDGVGILDGFLVKSWHGIGCYANTLIIFMSWLNHNN